MSANEAAGLDAPVLWTPVNEAYSVPLTVMLTFSTVPGATRYNVQVATDYAFKHIVYATNAPMNHTPFTAPAPGVYYWRAQAASPSETSSFSLPSVFSNAAQDLPSLGTPVLWTPLNDAYSVPLTVMLTFSNVTGATRYNVQVATDKAFSHIVYSTNVPMNHTSFTAPAPGVYYWRAQAESASEKSLFSKPFVFSNAARDLPSLGTPVLLTPLNEAYSVPLTVMLRFTEVTGATRYNVQVATDKAFSHIVYSTNVGMSHTSFTAPAPGVYYWRAQAENATEKSLFSKPFVFSNAAQDLPSLGAPTLLVPVKGQTNVPTSAELRCSEVAGATRYNIQVASDYAFRHLLFTVNNPLCRARFVGAAGTHYWWRAQAQNATEKSLFTLPFGFTTVSSEAVGMGAVSSFDAAETIPTAYALHENYPNPFNPSTTIMFDVPEATHIKLAVYDLLGQEVMEIASGDVEAGRHSYTIDASGLSSGLYLYRIESPGFTQTRRMMLLK